MEFTIAKKLIHSVKDGQHWFGSDYNANIYRGCNQGCIYCDSRSSCYQISDFDKIRPKEKADEKIDRELSNKRKKGIISLGGMSDPYNFLESELKYTRNSLKSIDKFGFGVHIVTKSILVLRDIEVLKNINGHSSVNVGITITTANDRLQQLVERNVPKSSERFRALKTLSDEGIYAGILLMPILPFINDTVENITQIVEEASKAGAKYIYPSFGVTLRDNQRQHFFNKVGQELTAKYVNEFGDSYMCVSPNHKKLKDVFVTLCNKYGIVYKMKDIINGSKDNIKNQQISLF